jgi:hypothetical protein
VTTAPPGSNSAAPPVNDTFYDSHEDPPYGLGDYGDDDGYGAFMSLMCVFFMIVGAIVKTLVDGCARVINHTILSQRAKVS